MRKAVRKAGAELWNLSAAVGCAPMARTAPASMWCVDASWRNTEKYRVRIGLLSDQDAEIKEGVQVDNIVVAHAGASLRDGDEVSVLLNEESDRTGQV